MKMKKAICILFSVLMALSVLSMTASAVATPLEAGSSMASAALIPNFGVDYVSSLSKGGEVDWFKFITLSEDAYYTISFNDYSISTGGYDGNQLNLFFYDMYLRQLQHICTTMGTTRSFNIKLENNTTYYLKICMGNDSSFKNNTGNYEVSVSFKYDNVKNTMSEAQSIQLNQTYVQSLDGKGDVDWYTFTTATKSAEYTVCVKDYNITTGGYDGNQLNIFLYDGNKQEIKHALTTYGRTATFTVQLNTSTTYFLQILMGSDYSDHIGNYEFSVNTDALTPAKTLQSISVLNLPNKTTYEYGESLNTAGLVVRARYSDNTTADVTGYSVKGFNATLPGTQTLTVSYTENGVSKTTTFTVTVKPAVTQKTLQYIYTASLPYKTSYAYGESFNSAGLVVRALYSDNSSADVTGYSVKGFNATLPGTQTLTVSYTENGVTKTTTFTVTVKPAATQNTLQSIYVVFLPDKTTYEIGEALDTKGMVIHGDYSDGTSAQITDYSVSGFDSTNAGEKVVTITARVNGVTRSCTFTVMVNEKEEQKPDAASTWQKILNVIKLIWSPLVKIISALLKLIKALSGALA